MLLDRLRALYAAAPSGFDAPLDDRRAVERVAGEGAQAYGELREPEALRLLRWARLGPEDVLFDLGSGVGKLVLLAACATPVGRAVGVELSAHHHLVATGVLDGLVAGLAADAATRLRERVRFVRGDLRRVDLAAATVVYACSNCFPDEVRAALAAKAHAAPGLRALLTTRELPPPWGGERFEELGRARVLTTWSESERVIVYRRRERAQGRGTPVTGP